jgi:hypothetical protein
VSKPWWWGRKWWWPVNDWWMSQQPPFAVCFDCGVTGLTSLKFASLMPGRVEGHPLTGAGTCVECSPHDRDGVNR